MAQLDTGLGWNAKDSWLFHGAGVIATIAGGLHWNISGFETQQIPVTSATQADVVNDGLLEYDYISNRARYRRYLGANKPGALIAIFHDGHVNPYRTIIYVPDNTYRVYTQSMEWDSYQGGLGVESNWYTTTVGTDTITYTGGLGSGINIDPNDFYVPQFPFYSTNEACAQAGWAYITQSADVQFTKDNQGYAVACIAKWYTQNGVLITTPILISSDSSYADMSCDSSSYNVAKTSFLHDGTRFYIAFWDCVDKEFSSMLTLADLTQFGAAAIEKVFRLIAAESFSNILVTDTQDPYDPFGNTEEGGGEPDPDPDDDDIEEDPLPTTSFADAGFCRIYSPSLVQLDSLSNYLWTDQTFLQTVINHLKQILENPIDAIISLSLIPCVPPTSAAEEVKVMFIPTGVYMPPVTNQFVEVDCGSFTLKEMYGSALDYNPYTSVQLYLPYVGIVQLDTDEVMGKTIHVGYRIDVVTGVCCAYVKAGGDVLYQFSGHCSIQQPITSADFSGYINAVLAAGKLVASIAAAGAGAPEVAASLVGAPAPSVTSTSSDTRTTERNEATGRQITAGTRHHETKTEHSGASFGEVAARGISNTVGSVMNSKTIIQHSGGFSGNSGYIAAVRRPYLIVTRPRIANPEQYAQFNGRPSMIYMNLGSCTGFTQVQSVHLTGIDATNPELSEIATLLTSGVIF